MVEFLDPFTDLLIMFKITVYSSFTSLHDAFPPLDIRQMVADG